VCWCFFGFINEGVDGGLMDFFDDGICGCQHQHRTGKSGEPAGRNACATSLTGRMATIPFNLFYNLTHLTLGISSWALHYPLPFVVLLPAFKPK
jgi:hypothetical protein